jgi:plastocyanin
VRTARRLATALLLFLFVACSGSPTAPASAAASAVSITSAFAFEPAAVTISRGASVTWTNTSGNNHTVTSGTPEQPSNKFNRALEPKATFTVKFDDAGTFAYFCSIHMTMRGTVVVR